ncbi:polysaccharide deacetylase family protein [Streptomyces sp. NPDC048845]|uniref:polysaccharide deacetylase family protein n=1 Tax=Streptomyces sp. NPDC048845 TaxID=3155390 RepID=UPI003424F6A6
MGFVRKDDKNGRGWTTRARAAPEPHGRQPHRQPHRHNPHRKGPRRRARTSGVVLGLALAGIVSGACAQPPEDGWPPAPGVRDDRASASVTDSPASVTDHPASAPGSSAPASDAPASGPGRSALSGGDAEPPARGDGVAPLAGTALALAESAERIRKEAAAPSKGTAGGRGTPKGRGTRAAPGDPEDPADRERRRAAAEKWGLAEPPLLPPPPPRTKPELHTPPGFRRGSDMTGLPHVIARVPTDDPVVFLTIDDGDHKDPRLLRMLDELDVPVSAFLSHYLIRDGYDYFRTLRAQGSRVQNHTLDHPYLTSLSYAGQREQICGQQRHLEREIGERPRLLRPPYGAYDRDTLRAATACGIDVVPLWAAEAFPGRMEFRDGKRLRPGDIVLTHFRGPRDWDGTMPDVVRRVLRTATGQGLAVALLEDYV